MTVIVWLWLLSCDYDCYWDCYCVIMTFIVWLWLLLCDYDCCVIMTVSQAMRLANIYWLLLLCCYDCYWVIMTVIMTVIVLLWLWARRCGWRIHIDDCYCVVVTVIVLLWLLLCYHDCYCVIMSVTQAMQRALPERRARCQVKSSQVKWFISETPVGVHEKHQWKNIW